MIYDLIISIAPKDINKVTYCLESINKFFSVQPQNTFLVSSYKIKIKDTTHIYDNEATPFNKEKINFRRKGWIFQQLVKLFPSFIINEDYIVVDSDVIFNKNIDIGQNFYISDREQCHSPYFEFMKHFGIEKVFPYTFINDFMVFNQKICQEMTGPPIDFFEKMNMLMSETCYPAEFEMYGNFVMNKYPNLYGIKYQKTKLHGKYVAEDHWSDEEIKSLINDMSDKDFDLFTIHSWT
jgi:hypothetical protein